MSKELVHEFIEVGNVFQDWVSLFNMKILSDEMVKPIPIKSRHNMITEFVPRALTKVDFDGLHPKCSSALEIDGS
jgi:hypothetical protein